MEEKKFDKIVNYATSNGFFYRSNQIYEGKSGFYDYGSIGTLLKRKYENLWRIYFGKLLENSFEIEPTNIMERNVFVASKHIELFNDPITECKNGCRYRADKLIEEKLGIKAESLTIDEMNKIFKNGDILCPKCGSKLSEVKLFNLMFNIFVGPESSLIVKLEYFNKKYKEIAEVLNKLSIYKKTKITKGELMYIYKEYLKNKELFAFEYEDFIYFSDKDKKIIIGYPQFNDEEIYLYTNEDIKISQETDIRYLEELFNNSKYVKIEDINGLFEILKEYNNQLKNLMYLRPETAQGVYVNFPIEYIINRYRLPLGLYIIGKAFRNEISPRNALIRMREFTQAELQIFFDYENNLFDLEFEKYKDQFINVLLVKDREENIPYKTLNLEEIHKQTEIPKFYLYFLYKVFFFFTKILKIPENRVRFYELSENEKSFYNMYHFDLEIYLDDLGWVENGGVHFRVLKIDSSIVDKVPEELKNDVLKLFYKSNEILVGYDLWNHFLLSKERKFIAIRKDGTFFIPVELELSFGVDRNIFSMLYIFYEHKDREILKIPEYLAPIQIAVFPLLENNDQMINKAKVVYKMLRKKFDVYYDDSESIGKRYARQDKIGTPFCITIDHQTLQDNTVTIRFRDSKQQIRLNINNLKTFFDEQFDIYNYLEKIMY